MMRGLKWISREQRDAEFAVAKRLLRLATDKPAPAGTVLPRTSYDPLTQKEITLTYRFFIDNEGTVYAKAEAHFAEGASGKATIIESEEGKRWVAKEATPKESMCKAANKEASVARDVGIAKAAYWKDKAHTLILKYLGISLDQYITEKESTLTDDERLDLAIKLSREVYKLHAGLTSKTGTCYAHLDIKSNNFTIDADGNVHLIDFGFSEEDPDQPMRKLCGTGLYLMPNFIAKKPETKKSMDVFALARTLYFPTEFNFIGTKSSAPGWYNRGLYNGNILTDQQVKENDLLLSWVRTIAYGRLPNEAPSDLCALALHIALILQKHRINCVMNDSEKEAFATHYEQFGLEDTEASVLRNKSHFRLFQILVKNDLLTKENFQHIANNPDQFYTHCKALLEQQHLNRKSLKKLLKSNSSDCCVEKIILERALTLARNNTSDPVKKKFCEISITGLDKCNLPALISLTKEAARVLSHHTNWFFNRSSEKKPNAYMAAEKGLEALRKLFRIKPAEWEKILTGNPDNKGAAIPVRTYGFFKQQSKNPPIETPVNPPSLRI